MRRRSPPRAACATCPRSGPARRPSTATRPWNGRQASCRRREGESEVPADRSPRRPCAVTAGSAGPRRPRRGRGRRRRRGHVLLGSPGARRRARRAPDPRRPADARAPRVLRALGVVRGRRGPSPRRLTARAVRTLVVSDLHLGMRAGHDVLHRRAALEALRAARVSVRYPGVWLGGGVWATHGHYVDRHLVTAVPRTIARGRLAPLPDRRLRPEDYEYARRLPIDPLRDAVHAVTPVELR